MSNSESLPLESGGLFGNASTESPKPAEEPTSAKRSTQVRGILHLVREFFETRGAEDPAAEAVAFVRHFASITLRVPGVQLVERVLSENQIAQSLSRDPSPENAKRLSNIHLITRRGVRSIFKTNTGSSLNAYRQQKTSCRRLLRRRVLLRLAA